MLINSELTVRKIPFRSLFQNIILTVTQVFKIIRISITYVSLSNNFLFTSTFNLMPIKVTKQYYEEYIFIKYLIIGKQVESADFKVCLVVRCID